MMTSASRKQCNDVIFSVSNLVCLVSSMLSMTVFTVKSLPFSECIHKVLMVSQSASWPEFFGVKLPEKFGISL